MKNDFARTLVTRDELDSDGKIKKKKKERSRCGHNFDEKRNGSVQVAEDDELRNVLTQTQAEISQRETSIEADRSLSKEIASVLTSLDLKVMNVVRFLLKTERPKGVMFSVVVCCHGGDSPPTPHYF